MVASPQGRDTALRVSGALIDHRYPHAGALAQRAWTLRHTLNFYDALYVGLASYLNLPLLTADARIARAPGLPCQAELA
jgi:predicted nucleic acid-binding protein